MKLLCAPGAALEAALDKAETLRVARECGIDTPRIWSLAASDALEALATEVRFPVMLKWVDPNAAARALEPAGLELGKAEYAYDPGELRNAFGRYRQLGSWASIR